MEATALLLAQSDIRQGGNANEEMITDASPPGNSKTTICMPREPTA